MVISRDFCWGVITFFGGKFENHRFCAYRVGSGKPKKKTVPKVLIMGPSVEWVRAVCARLGGKVVVVVVEAPKY